MVKQKEVKLKMEIPIASSSNALMFQGIFQGREKEIKITQNKVCIFDFIQVVTGQANPHSTWARIKKNHEHEIVFSSHQFEKGKKKTPVVDDDNLKELIKRLIPGSRIPLSRKRKILHHFGLNGNDDNLRKYIEEEVHEKLLKALKMFNGIQQYSVLEYRIDLYFPKQKVAIECDEHGHVNYLNEELREKQITTILGNEWIRYNPYDKGFDIFDLISQILEKLVQ